MSKIDFEQIMSSRKNQLKALKRAKNDFDYSLDLVRGYLDLGYMTDAIFVFTTYLHAIILVYHGNYYPDNQFQIVSDGYKENNTYSYWMEVYNKVKSVAYSEWYKDFIM